jgi:hypothetical protein
MNLHETLRRLGGITYSDADRDRVQENADIEAIVGAVMLLQKNAALKQRRGLRRGTHAKGIVVGAVFEVFDVASGRDSTLASRLAKGIFAKPGVYPATVRFANSDSLINSDFKADVRALSFSVDLDPDGTALGSVPCKRQDFAMQNARTLPLNDACVFRATMKVLTAKNPLSGLLSLSASDRLPVVRAIVLAQEQSRQAVKPYQVLRYWSTVPFRHGPDDVVMQSLIPAESNSFASLSKADADALVNELARHVADDHVMSSFNFGLQLLDPQSMQFGGRHHDANFWIENASVEWPEAQAPFHTVARLTLAPRSQLNPEASESAYIDVTGNAASDSEPIGSINRARQRGELASRRARASAGHESTMDTAMP